MIINKALTAFIIKCKCYFSFGCPEGLSKGCFLLLMILKNLAGFLPLWDNLPAIGLMMKSPNGVPLCYVKMILSGSLRSICTFLLITTLTT